MPTRAALILALAAPSFTLAAEKDLAEIDRFVEAQMERHGIPGVALAIIQDGVPVHVRGFGVTRPGGPPVTAKTPFVLGSLSKSFTALAVMQLVEAGRVDLDSPVERYIPSFRLAEPTKTPITLRHLLHHTSGIPSNAHGAGGDESTLEDQVHALGAFAAEAGPGERHLYSSMNYLILGLVVERVSGEGFAAYVRRHIFEPLRMTSSFTSMNQAQSAGISSGHQLWFGFAVPAGLRHERDRLPTAGLISSAADLATYFQALMGVHPSGEAVVSANTRAAIEAPGAPAESFSYGLGWRNGTTAGVPSLWHGGALSHFRGALVVHPSQRWGVVVLSNLGSRFENPTRHIAEGVTARLFGKQAPSQIWSARSISRWSGVLIGVWVAGAVWSIIRLKAWRSKASPQVGERKFRRRVFFRAGVSLVWPAALAFGLPAVIGLPLRALFEAVPDLTVGLGLAALLEAAAAGLRVRFVLAARPPLAPTR